MVHGMGASLLDAKSERPPWQRSAPVNAALDVLRAGAIDWTAVLNDRLAELRRYNRLAVNAPA
jgi:hypothetical protein